MISKEAIWEQLSSVVAEAGLRLFDLHASGDSLKVYICGVRGSDQGVNLDQCAGVAKRINELANLDQILPGDGLIEVSSPGINRELRRPEHFDEAIGERVRCVVRNSEGKNLIVLAVIKATTPQSIELEVVSPKGKRKRGDVAAAEVKVVAREDVVDARVDFDFAS